MRGAKIGMALPVLPNLQPPTQRLNKTLQATNKASLTVVAADNSDVETASENKTVVVP